MCVMPSAGVTPCQCFPPGAIHTVSPGPISSTGPPSRCTQPQRCSGLRRTEYILGFAAGAALGTMAGLHGLSARFHKAASLSRLGSSVILFTSFRFCPAFGSALADSVPGARASLRGRHVAAS
jgi:hypothetical protein